MADFLYDRMSKRMKFAALMFMAGLYVSVVGAIAYVIIHFVTKYW